MRIAMRSVVAVAAALLVSCGGGADTRTVELTIRHSRFVPAEVSVPAGARVRFVVRNLDPIAHELIVGDEEVQRRHEDGTEPHHGSVPGEVSVPAGTTRTTTYEFDGPGSVPFACHLPGHWAFGMRGTVRVG